MKFDVDDKNRCRLVCVKFHLNRCRFAVAVAKCLGGSLFWGHSKCRSVALPVTLILNGVLYTVYCVLYDLHVYLGLCVLCEVIRS